MYFSSANLLIPPLVLRGLLLLLLFGIACHDGRDAEIRGALSIGVTVVVVEKIAIGRRTGALVVLISDANRGYAGGGALGLHFPAEENSRVLLVVLARDSSAGSSSDDVAAERRQGQSVSLPSS